MARNTNKDHRIGFVTNRVQKQLPNGDWQKQNASTGKPLGSKPTPYKGVAKNRDDRRN